MTLSSEEITKENIIFIFHDSQEHEILVARREWFKPLPVCKQLNEYGQYGDDCPFEGTEEGCQCATMPTYQYWDGNNHRTISLETNDLPSDYSEITDEDQIDQLLAEMRTVHKMEPTSKSTGVDHYELGEHTWNDSIWQGHWEIYEVFDKDYTDDYFA